jgi:hypothetical protein
MPKDLEERKERINKKIEVLDTERQSLETKNISSIIEKYKTLYKEIENYTTECNKRGIEKNNDQLLVEINDIIKNLEQELEKSFFGNWYYNENGTLINLTISESHRYFWDDNLNGSSSGTWDGDMNNFTIYQSGFPIGRGYFDKYSGRLSFLNIRFEKQ